MADDVLLKTDLKGLTLKGRGKVRDIYDLGDSLLIIATDRISAFDYIMPNGIPDKGKILNGLSLFWFDFTKDIIKNHIMTSDVSAYPRELEQYRNMLRGRSMIVTKAKPFAAECVVRGYLSGSGWKEYRETGRICGISIKPGFVESDKLPEPIFTPSTKAAAGHDENIDLKRFEEVVGKKYASSIIERTISIYRKAYEYAYTRGIIISDTKFEFGLTGKGELIIIDEMLTPDSSRFWSIADYRPGGPQKSFDKQFLRDWLESIHWNKKPPTPVLPDEIVKKTREKYLEAYVRITGRDLQ
ncbi:MAG: phosphoribosylaminoimidazolesuccinocarboxamide synthase [Deltaproteobacteria bacterium]|nr:phosphoribosylaminoimidazolesuccinocarboxamide synthase [Deltaproteobacteria bacterium]MCL5276480.1 phosphoribosylaminoimidazolesuccinocarboxamide synthase [Deltaproteobacteria bacterium]